MSMKIEMFHVSVLVPNATMGFYLMVCTLEWYVLHINKSKSDRTDIHIRSKLSWAHTPGISWVVCLGE